MVELGVNIDHVATVREARRTNEPDPVWAATLAQLGGADGITLHLREDRRHIQDRDLRVLRETVTVKLNLELACNPDVLEIACQTRPDQATLVPERREELTTEGGLLLARQRANVAEAIRRLQDAGVKVSLFLDPDPAAIDVAAELNADAVELHTGQYALAPDAATQASRAGPAGRSRQTGRCGPIGAARRPWPDLPQRPADRHDRGHGRTEHRPQHRCPGDHGWIRASGPRDEKTRLVSARRLDDRFFFAHGSRMF